MLLAQCPRLRASGARVVLASASPRRRQLFEQLLPGVPFAQLSSTFAEDLEHAGRTPAEYALATAAVKANDVWQEHQADVLISADTVVVRGADILEKPKSAEHAFEMLRSLSGRTHQVVTGVCVLFHPGYALKPASSSTTAAPSEPIRVSFSVTTDVTFSQLTDDSIRLYVESGEPMDKAGAYGYQALAATFISAIHGCYYNVVGLPLNALAKEIAPHLERLLDLAEGHEPSSALTPAAAATPAAKTHSLHWTCCFCEKPAHGYHGRNNPWPLKSSGVDCCDACNEAQVIPARRDRTTSS